MKSIFKNILFLIIIYFIFCINIKSVLGLSNIINDKGIICTLQNKVSVNGEYDGAYTKVLSTRREDNIEAICKTVRQAYCDKFQTFANDGYKEPTVVDKVILKDASGTEVQSAPLTDMTSIFEYLDNTAQANLDVYTIEFSIDKMYKFTIFSSVYYKHVHEIDEDTGVCNRSSPQSRKDEFCESCKQHGESTCEWNSSIHLKYWQKKEQMEIYTDMKKALEQISNAAKLGLVAGSVGAGFNVGTVYSTSQKSLAGIMEKKSNNTYDFKDTTALRSTFAYYMNPLLGKMEFGEDKEYKTIPKDLNTWMELVADVQVTTEYDINLDEGFFAFKSGLKEDMINAEGLKITENIPIRNGVRKVTDVSNSENPKSVISYTMKIAYPYAFYRVGDNYKLHARNLRIESDYEYCIYNDYIYSANMFDGTQEKIDPITDRAELGIERSQLFLFYQMNSDGSYIGVILVGEFDECVINTKQNLEKNEPLYYATGRKIGFSNGYSDLLLLNSANYNLMYTTREGGKEGYIPRNVAFFCSPEEILVLKNNLSITPEMISQGKKEYMQFNSPSNEMVENELKDIENHPLLSDEPEFIKFYIVLKELRNETAIAEFKETSENGEEINEEDLKDMDLTHWSFAIIRNNQYIDDSSLKSWLGTQTAKSKTYVDAQGLLNKITGEFASNLDKLTYGDWLEMQKIKSDINYEKDMWLVRIFNIMSILVGVFLIVFAILICLAYWIDIFNTLMDFSILQFISFGHLYSVENKDIIPYVSMDNTKVKYVTFKDVLIIAFFCCAGGIIFMNVSLVVQFIINMFNYIMFVLGG